MEPPSNHRSHQSWQGRALLTLLALILLGALAWRSPISSVADSGALPVYMPIIMRDGPTQALLPTEHPRPTVTMRPTATPTVAATATTTPTETPPAICFPTSGTYPIVIRSNILDASGFINPDGYYSDETYQNKTLKRVYLQDSTNPSGGFNWVHWRAGHSSSSITMTAMLSGTGNLGEGFDEAPWPLSNTLNLPPPAGYPLYPHQLNSGDWTYRDIGISASMSLSAALDYHIANRTLMILPLYDMEDDNGPSGSFHIARPGAFLLEYYNLSGLGYLDLVYIEQPALVLCTG